MNALLKKSLFYIFFLYLIFINSAPSFAENKRDFIVVSDVDDTLKITNVPSYYESLKNLIMGTDTFLGMKELFEAFQHHTDSFNYLSGSPQYFLESTKHALLDLNGLPPGTFIFNNWYNWVATFDFKTHELNQLAAKFKQPFLVLGDNTQYDASVFVKFQSNLNKINSDRPLQAYIHLISNEDELPIRAQLPKVFKAPNKDLPVSRFMPYSTAFDIALNEVEAGRLTEEEAIVIGKSILQANKPDLLIPSYVYCPVHVNYFLGNTSSKNKELVELSENFAAYVESMCVERSTDLTN